MGAWAEEMMKTTETARAILTDVHFWIPVAVLAIGLSLLFWLH